MHNLNINNNIQAKHDHFDNTEGNGLKFGELVQPVKTTFQVVMTLRSRNDIDGQKLGNNNHLDMEY